MQINSTMLLKERIRIIWSQVFRLVFKEEARIAAEKLAAEIEQSHETALLENELFDRQAEDRRRAEEAERLKREEEIRREVTNIVTGKQDGCVKE